MRLTWKMVIVLVGFVAFLGIVTDRLDNADIGSSSVPMPTGLRVGGTWDELLPAINRGERDSLNMGNYRSTEIRRYDTGRYELTFQRGRTSGAFGPGPYTPWVLTRISPLWR